MVSTDQAGEITEWEIYVSNIPLGEPFTGVIYGELLSRHFSDELTSDYVATTECFSDSCSSSAWDQAGNSNTPGIWKREVSVFVPIPNYIKIALTTVLVVTVLLLQHRISVASSDSLRQRILGS